MSRNQTVILVIFVAYLLINAVIGILFSRHQNRATDLSSEKKYFIGGRNMNGLLLAMTTMATYTSVSSFVSGPGAAGLTYGYAQAWVAAVQVPVTFLVLGVLGNKLALVSRRTGSVTVVGFLKARYKSDALVIITSLLMVAFFTAQMIGQFTGGATLIASITGLPHVTSLIIFGAVVIIYTAFGGFSAVAITDTIQGIVMCIGTFLFLFFVLRAGGGLSGIDAGLQENLPGVYDNLFAVYKPGSLLSFWVLVGFGTLGLPQTAVRSMGFKDTKSLHQAMWIGAVTCSFIIVGMHLAGTWAGALVDTAELPTSDYFVPYIIQKIMPIGLAGIFLAAPMAAVMSTVDSLLILASASIIKDLIRTYLVKDDAARIASYDRHVKTYSTIFTFIFGIAVILLTINPPDIIFFLNLFALGGLECTFFWPLVGGVFWRKGTRQAAVASSLGAAATYIFCYYNVSVAGINAVVWGLLAGGIIYFVVGMITGRNGLDEDVLEKCF
ncbi:MAG: sodium/pantothenate symporter [Clostridiales bacterium]|nr:sodium/pantothenate symporter [Candidatus Crickella merdequi]